jgi:hypothetical protein
VRTLMTAVAALLATVGALAVPTESSAATCTGIVQINAVDFSPAQAQPGQTATATVTAQNCTAQPQTASLMIVAQFRGAAAGIPAGCPALDPLPPQSVTFPAGGTTGASQSYLIFAGCTATALRVTARYTDSSGTVLATRYADLPIAAAAPCAVTYRTTRQWPGGFVAQIAITNSSTAAITGWLLTFAYPGDQHVDTAWNATVQQHATAVTAGNLPDNVTITPGATVTFGVLGRWHLADTAPTDFTLNGVSCR